MGGCDPNSQAKGDEGSHAESRICCSVQGQDSGKSSRLVSSEALATASDQTPDHQSAPARNGCHFLRVCKKVLVLIIVSSIKAQSGRKSAFPLPLISWGKLNGNHWIYLGKLCEQNLNLSSASNGHPVDEPKFWYTFLEKIKCQETEHTGTRACNKRMPDPTKPTLRQTFEETRSQI